jgi:branched-chain amino acid transport system permease protein
MINPYIDSLLIILGINALFAYSFYIPLLTEQPASGQGAFMAIGAYFSAALTRNFLIPFPIALTAGAFLAGLTGALVGWPALRLRGLYFVILTLGFGEVVRVFFLNSDYFGGSYGFSRIAESTTLLNVYLVLGLTIFFVNRMNRSSLGRALEAIKENGLAAESLGINTTKLKVLMFGAGAAVAGVSGALYAHYALFIDSNNFGFLKSIEPILYTLVGGAGSLWGPLLGAVILTILPEMLRAIQEWRMVFYGLIMILLMTFRPQGLLTKGMLKHWWKKRTRVAG